MNNICVFPARGGTERGRFLHKTKMAAGHRSHRGADRRPGTGGRGQADRRGEHPAARGLLGGGGTMAEPAAEPGAGGGSDGHPRARRRLEALLNRSLRIRMSDGRTLVGAFLCTDREANVILGSAQEFLKASDSFPGSEPRVLGLAMVPGHHIVSIEVEQDGAGPPYP